MDIMQIVVNVPVSADTSDVEDYLWEVAYDYARGERRGKRCGEGYSWSVRK